MAIKKRPPTATERREARRARLNERVEKYTKRGTKANKRGAARAEEGESRKRQDKNSARNFLKANTAKEKLAKMDKRAEKKRTGVKKKIDEGMNYAGGSKTFNEKTGRHEKPDGTPMKRKNARMKKRATRKGAPPKGPEATPYRGDRPKNGGTIKQVVKKSGISTIGKGGGNGTYKKSEIKPAAKRTPAKRSAPKKAAPKRSTQKRRVARKRRSAKK
jgi:hypothetical protein